MNTDNPGRKALISSSEENVAPASAHSANSTVYRGRFAPSPTGPLHAGSLVAALASWLDARAQGGQWLVRIEDLDPPREMAGAHAAILATLAAFDLVSDAPVLVQSTRHAAYAQALAQLQSARAVFACTCTRREVLQLSGVVRGSAQRYPGTCRERAPMQGQAVAWRLRVSDEPVSFVDRAVGLYTQRLESEIGDFVLKRADGLWAYQLAVVVDDAFQGITDVVRGADLLDNTPRQIALQRRLGFLTPRYLHVPIVKSRSGEKLSKQTGARALDETQPLQELERAWLHLGFARLGAASVRAFYAAALPLWRKRFHDKPSIHSPPSG